MNDLLEILKQKYGFLFNSYGFKNVDSEQSDMFDNAGIVLKTDNIELVFTKDRGEFYMYFRFMHNKSTYYYESQHLFRLIGNLKEIPGQIDTPVFLNEFENNLPEILKLFTEEEIPNTIKKLKKLKATRL